MSKVKKGYQLFLIRSTPDAVPWEHTLKVADVQRDQGAIDSPAHLPEDMEGGLLALEPSTESSAGL